MTILGGEAVRRCDFWKEVRLLENALGRDIDMPIFSSLTTPLQSQAFHHNLYPTKVIELNNHGRNSLTVSPSAFPLYALVVVAILSGQ